MFAPSAGTSLTTASPPRKASPLLKPAPKISAKRQQELDDINRMMEDDDEPQGPYPNKQTEHSDLEEFPEEVPAPAPEEESQDTAEPPQTPTTDSQTEEPKRKRGKRRVMKRTTKRDEKGFLCTANVLFLLLIGQ